MNNVGVILSGGAGLRMGGVRKADLRLGGTPLLARVFGRLAPQCDRVLFSIAREAAVSKAAESLALETIEDEPDGPPGPVAGLFAAIRWCAVNAPEARILTVAVDTPFFPSDFSTRANALLTDDVGGVIAAFGENRYPTNILWRQEALEATLSGASRDRRGPSLFSLAEAAGCVSLDYAPLATANPFANVNALPDLLALSRRS
ncbi:molybdenum cofactor guanylyltransferase [Pelagibacterium halotolerans]|uniref:molybdenum cofactor guanylyltransferase n=1 Tax=Pelagibacterium halotolerans TaxID=531813 RepID=UPI00384C4464